MQFYIDLLQSSSIKKSNQNEVCNCIFLSVALAVFAGQTYFWHCLPYLTVNTYWLDTGFYMGGNIA